MAPPLRTLLPLIRHFYECPSLGYYPFLSLLIRWHESKVGQGFRAGVDHNTGSNASGWGMQTRALVGTDW